MPELLIFKAGKYPQGDRPKERVQKMVDAYDPERSVEAPVVIGHKWFSRTDEDRYAHGWVRSLRMDGAGKVWAAVDEFSADAKRAIAEKKLRYISAEFYEYDKQGEGAAPYLRAIALLGRDNPAVAGTKLPTMFNRSGGVLSTLNEKEGIAAFTRKVCADDKSAFSVNADNDKKKIQQEEKMDEEKLKRMEAELAASKAQVAAFQKEKGFAGFSEAAEAFYAANPAAFEDEGGAA